MVETSQRDSAAALLKLKQVVQRRCGAALALWGEPGVGKSYLARQTLKDLGCRNHSFHAREPLFSVVRGLPRPSGRQTLPAWAETILNRIGEGEAVEPRKSAEALAALLSALAPVVLCFEDIHEADPERLDLIKTLAPMVSRSKGVGLLVTGRALPPEGLEPVRLEPLSEEVSQRLLEGDIGNELPEAALSWIYRRAVGNPLFSLEYVRFLARQGFLWNDGRRWNWREPPDQTMPLTVEALIEQQLLEAARDVASRQALESRAVLPPVVSDSVWAEVAGLDVEVLDRTRETLQRLGILRGSEFAHPLFGEVQRRTLRPDRRRELAKRALLALGDINLRAAVEFVPDAELSPEESLDWLTRAAELEVAAGNSIQAARLRARAVQYAAGEERGRMALEVAQQLKYHDLDASLSLSQIAAINPANGPHVAELVAGLLARQGRISELEKTLALFRVKPPEGPEWVAVLAGARSSAGDHKGAVTLWREHLKARINIPASTVYQIAHALSSTGHLQEALDLVDYGLALANLSMSERCGLGQIKAIVEFRKGNFLDAEKLFAEALDQARQTDVPSLVAKLCFNHAVALKELQLYDEMQRRVEEAVLIYQEIGESRNAAHSQVLLAEHLIEYGKYEQAETLLHDALSTLRLQDGFSFLVDCEGMLSLLYRSWLPPHGKVLALKHAESALRCARLSGNSRLVVQALFDYSVSLSLNGGFVAGRQAAEEALALTDSSDYINSFTGLLARGLALGAEGKGVEALGDLNAARAAAEKAGLGPRANEIGLEIARLTGDLSLARELLRWFEERGLMNGANLARRYFPQLGDTASKLNPVQPTPGMRLEVLGPIRLEGQAVRGRKRQELLALLLEARITGRRGVDKLELIDALYPGDDEARAASSLKALVSSTRAELGAVLLETTPTGYALGESVSSDVEMFLGGGGSELWRGAFLEGLTPADESVREAVYLALQARIEAILESDPREAARLGRLLTDADPYDPGALRLALGALRRAQNHKTLNRLYDEARERMLEVGERLPPTWQAFLGST
ncbi:MAG: AAA family ATPase [Meiothermus sp.]|nr:AAA family ATPase [Meiothermus sp.]